MMEYCTTVARDVEGKTIYIVTDSIGKIAVGAFFGDSRDADFIAELANEQNEKLKQVAEKLPTWIPYTEKG